MVFQKSKFASKNNIFLKNYNFCQKSIFFSKIQPVLTLLHFIIVQIVDSPPSQESDETGPSSVGSSGPPFGEFGDIGATVLNKIL